MPHDDPFAGKTVHADWAYYLDTSGTYTPELTATTTDPNLGADGEAVGTWHRNGHRITVWPRFLFSGAGVAAGSGQYRISLPFDADTSVMEAAGASAGRGAQLGSGYLRDANSIGNSGNVTVWLVDASTVALALHESTSRGVTDSLPFTWAADDAFSLVLSYLADPAGLPS